MTKFAKQDCAVLQFFLFILACTAIFGIREYFGETISGRLIWFSGLFVLYFYFQKYKLPLVSKVYVLSIIIGFFLHQLVDVSVEDSLNGTVIVRIIPIFVLVVAQQQNCPPRTFILLFLLFFIAECGIAIYEKFTLIHLIDYKNFDNFAATSVIMLDSSTFRSTSLMLHPLFNANTVSIFLAFILCSDFIKPLYKFLLLAFGLFALWTFNSRGAMIVWAIILLYRVVLYKAKLLYAAIMIVVLYFALPPLIEFVLYSGLFGRLTDLDFLDNSTLTRFEAFDVFFNEKWSLEDIVIGGRMLYYPGTDLILENGILLDLGYWGIIIGTIKVVCEILITYKTVEKYNIRDRILIMIAVWGVAFMNNNSFQTWLIPIFVLICVSLNNNMLYRKQHQYLLFNKK